MSLHFHVSLFADFSFAQGKSIRCLCFAQLRTSFRLADNVASLADVRRATRQCRPAPFAIEASTGCTSGSLLAARHSGRFPRGGRHTSFQAALRSRLLTIVGIRETQSRQEAGDTHSAISIHNGAACKALCEASTRSLKSKVLSCPMLILAHLARTSVASGETRTPRRDSQG